MEMRMLDFKNIKMISYARKMVEENFQFCEILKISGKPEKFERKSILFTIFFPFFGKHLTVVNHCEYTRALMPEHFILLHKCNNIRI